MKISTQSHIRDAVGIITAGLAVPGAYADLVAPLAAISPQVAHAWPFVLAASPILSRLIGTAFRIFNTFYPPAPETPPEKPTTPQP